MALVGVNLAPSRSRTVELGAEATHTAAAGVTERAERAAIEKVPRPARQSAFHGGRRLGRHHVKQLELCAGRFKSRGFAWREKHAGTLRGGVRFPVEADDARFRRLDDVDKVIVVAGVDVKMATLQHRSLVDGQRLRTTQTLATDRPFQPGCGRFGFGRVPINDENVADRRHGHSSSGSVTIRHLKETITPRPPAVHARPARSYPHPPGDLRSLATSPGTGEGCDAHYPAVKPPSTYIT